MSHILIFLWDHLILYEIMYISWPEPCFMLFLLRKADVFYVLLEIDRVCNHLEDA